MRLNPSTWFETKLHIANRLATRKDPPAEAEAQIILCCAVSALAALMWPGEYLDKKRFVQFLVEFCPETADLRFISIPILAERLASSKRGPQAAILRSMYFPRLDTKVVDASEIDQEESVVRHLIPDVPLRTIRDSSYASIIYSDLRCGLIHEYRLSRHLSSFGMSTNTNQPSYANIAQAISAADIANTAVTLGVSRSTARRRIVRTVRRLYIPYPYLRDTLRGTAQKAFAFWGEERPFERSHPTPWWAFPA